MARPHHNIAGPMRGHGVKAGQDAQRHHVVPGMCLVCLQRCSLRQIDVKTSGIPLEHAQRAIRQVLPPALKHSALTHRQGVRCKRAAARADANCDAGTQHIHQVQLSQAWSAPLRLPACRDACQPPWRFQPTRLGWLLAPAAAISRNCWCSLASSWLIAAVTRFTDFARQSQHI